jgi:hypothetical protein
MLVKLACPDTICYSENTVEIYNRWGVLVFETTGYNNNAMNAFNGILVEELLVNQSGFNRYILLHLELHFG